MARGKPFTQESGETVVMIRLDAKLDVNGVDASETASTEYVNKSAPAPITVK